MNFYKNKFFLLGNLAFIIFAIPIAMYLVKNQTTTRTGAVTNTPTIEKNYSENVIEATPTIVIKTNKLVSTQSLDKKADVRYAIGGIVFIILAIIIFTRALRMD